MSVQEAAVLVRAYIGRKLKSRQEERKRQREREREKEGDRETELG